MKHVKTSLVLAVMVAVGSVSVNFNGKNYSLKAGQHELFGAEEAESEAKLPDGVEGFSGKVRGIITKREGDKVYFKIGKVLKTWEDNSAKRQTQLKGLTVELGPGKTRNKRKRWVTVKSHVHFLKSLKVKQELTLELRNFKGEVFSVIELDDEQRKAADKIGEQLEKEGEALEKKMKDVVGFQGVVKGKIIRLNDDRRSFTYQVDKIVELGKGNKAKSPKNIEGLTLRTGAALYKNKKTNKWLPRFRQTFWIRALKPGSDLELNVACWEGKYISILKFSKEQQVAANKCFAEYRKKLKEKGRKDNPGKYLAADKKKAKEKAEAERPKKEAAKNKEEDKIKQEATDDANLDALLKKLTEE